MVLRLTDGKYIFRNEEKERVRVLISNILSHLETFSLSG